MSSALSIRSLSAVAGDKEIVKSLDLDLPFGEVHALMGPNGSGKSTLCHVLSGKSGYEVSGGVVLDGVDLLSLEVDDRARAGLLQGFQYPVEVPGVHLREFVEEAAASKGFTPEEAAQRIEQAAEQFDMTRFLDRALNDDLSGGEKKRSEIFQMAVLQPKVALLDEIDSGLDIDAVRQVAAAVEAMRSPSVGVLMITHYSRILRFVSPNRVHIMIDGTVVDSGGPELADELEEAGYDGIRARLGLSPPAAEPRQPKAADLFTDLPFER
jgi:Fe-S cluster assembly ATP-binding protein